MRVYAGGVEDYQSRAQSTDANLSFVHATWSHYWSDKQLNLQTVIAKLAEVRK